MYFRLGIFPFGNNYLSNICPPEYQEDIEAIIKAETEYHDEFNRILEIASGPKRADIKDDEETYFRNVSEEDALPMINLRQTAEHTRRSFTKKLENIVRQEFGFKKVGEGWVNETLLFYTVKRLLRENEVLFHYRPKWLNGLELDIFIPDKKMAIEYQGQQHFFANEVWGGEEFFKKTQQRDTRKAELCKKEGIFLFPIDYRDSITEQYIKQILSQNFK